MCDSQSCSVCMPQFTHYPKLPCNLCLVGCCLQGQGQPFSLISLCGVYQKMQDSVEDLALGVHIIKAFFAVCLMSREDNVGRRAIVSTSVGTIASNCTHLGSRGL